jgi:hypothetical protein
VGSDMSLVKVQRGGRRPELAAFALPLSKSPRDGQGAKENGQGSIGQVLQTRKVRRITLFALHPLEHIPAENKGTVHAPRSS